MLEELSKKNNKWLKMAYNLCGVYDFAGDLVQDMYIKLYEINEKNTIKEVKDTYVWVVMCNLLTDIRRKNTKYKLVGLETVLNNPDTNKPFELDDEDLKLLNRSKELRYIYRYYLEKAYDHSIRDIAEINNVNYGKVYRKLKEAREHILKDDIFKYKNKRNKREY